MMTGPVQPARSINNAWKREFYDQIDALVAALGVVQTWTPVDASGAGLVFTVTSANCIKVGQLVTVTLQMTYPATANGANASIGGAPFTALTAGGLYTAFGNHRIYTIQTGTKIITPSTTAGVLQTNANMSGQLVIIAGVYYAV